MRIFEENNPKKILAINCNKCKKTIMAEDNIIKEGIFEASYRFGYFSKKDGEIHSFDLCEDCYDEITGDFLIPPLVTELKEII
ncbi:MAG: hypothetical protein FWG91_11030 [Lachnospiraceae bacterium]|nr:hypothetical protein [Lachnospiraceae bacterium]